MKENPFKNIDGDYKMQINSIIKSNSKVKGNKKLALYLIEEVDVSYFYSFPELHTDKKIVLAALKQDSNVFARLDIKLKSQLDIAMEAIKSLVREKVNFIEVEKFLSKHFPEA